MTKNWNQSSVTQQKNGYRQCSIYQMEYYSVIKKNDMKFEGQNKELEKKTPWVR